MAIDIATLKEKLGEHFQGAIPLIIILILAIFALGQLGVVDLHSLPLIGSFFPAPVINIVVVGHLSDTFNEILGSKELRALNVRVYTLKPTQIENDPDLIRAYGGDIIILSATSTEDKELGYKTRRAIADAVRGGAKLLIIKDAGTLFPGDVTVFGWSYQMGDVAPVQTPVEREEVQEIIVNGTFAIQDREHPLFQGLKDFDVTGLPIIVGVQPKPPAKPLAYFDSDDGRSYEIIVESQAMLGRSMWLGFDPGDLVESLGGEGGKAFIINLINYLKYGR